MIPLGDGYVVQFDDEVSSSSTIQFCVDYSLNTKLQVSIVDFAECDLSVTKCEPLGLNLDPSVGSICIDVQPGSHVYFPLGYVRSILNRKVHIF